MSESKYAGFWLRFVAFLIDSIILNIKTDYDLGKFIEELKSYSIKIH